MRLADRAGLLAPPGRSLVRPAVTKLGDTRSVPSALNWGRVSGVVRVEPGDDQAILSVWLDDVDGCATMKRDERALAGHARLVCAFGAMGHGGNLPGVESE